MISFEVNKNEARCIVKIIQRTMRLMSGTTIDRVGLTMDLIACHANGCYLKLREFLEADDFNFLHDVVGIHRHLDRKTGQLDDCFVPRFAETGIRA